MAYIRTIPYQEAEGETRDAYDELFKDSGRISNVFAINALHPHLMTSFASHTRTVMRTESGLTAAERQMIATVVSALNKCVY